MSAMDKNMLMVGRLCESAYPAVNSGALPRSVSYPHEMAESTVQDLAYDEDFLQPFEPLAYNSGRRAGHGGLDSAVSNLDLFAQLELAQFDPPAVRPGGGSSGRFSSAAAAAASAAAAAAAARLTSSAMSDQMSRSDSCLAAAAAAAAEAEEAGVGRPLFDPAEDEASAAASRGPAYFDAGMATSSVSQSSANVKQILGKSASPNYQVVVGMDASVAMSGASGGSNMSTWMALAKSNKRFVSTSDLEASDATVDDSRPVATSGATKNAAGKPPMTTWSAVRTSSIKDVAAAAANATANPNASKNAAPSAGGSAGSGPAGGESAWRQLKSAGGSRLVSWQELNRIVREARPFEADQCRNEMAASTTQPNAVTWRRQQSQQQEQQQQQQQQEQLIRQQQQQNRYSGTLLELFKRASNPPASTPQANFLAAAAAAAAPQPPQPESTVQFLHGGGPGFREFRRRARELLSVDQQQQFPTETMRRRSARTGAGVGRSHSDLQRGFARRQQQQLPSLAFLRDSLPLEQQQQPAGSSTDVAAVGDSGIGTGDGSVSTGASNNSNFVCRNCGHPQHQQQQRQRRLADGKQKRSQSLDTTAVASAAAAAAAAVEEADAAESAASKAAAAADRHRRAAASSNKSTMKQRVGGAKRTRSEPHQLATSGAVHYEMTQSLTDSQEEETTAATTTAATPSGRNYPDNNISDDDQVGGGFRAKKSVSFCDRIQFHSPKGRAAAAAAADDPDGGGQQIWRGDFGGGGGGLRGVGSVADLGGSGAADSPHRQQTLLRRPLSLQLNYDVQVIPQQVGLYGDNDSPPLVFCGSPVGSPRRTIEAAAAAASSQQQQTSRLERLNRLVADAIRGVNDLILAATGAPLVTGAAAAPEASEQQQRLASVLAHSLCPPLHGLLTDELIVSGSGGAGSGSRLSFVRNRSQLWQLIEETCKPGSQPISRRLNETLRQVRAVGGLSTERLKFNAFVAACLNSKQLSAWFQHAASSEPVLKRYYKPGAFLRAAQTVHCELFADLSTALELLNSHQFSIDLSAAGLASSSSASSASASSSTAGASSRKPVGQQPLKARHDIKASQMPPPPPQHQKLSSAPAPPPRVQSRLPRPTGSATADAASIGSASSSASSSTVTGSAASIATGKTKSSGGGIRSSLLSGLMRRPGSSSSSSKQQSTGKR